MLTADVVVCDDQEHLEVLKARVEKLAEVFDTYPNSQSDNLTGLPCNILKEFYGRYFIIDWLLQLALVKVYFSEGWPQDLLWRTQTFLGGRTAQMLILRLDKAITWASTQKRFKRLMRNPALTRITELLSDQVGPKQTGKYNTTFVHLNNFVGHRVDIHEDGSTQISIAVRRYGNTVGVINMLIDALERTRLDVPKQPPIDPSNFNSISDCSKAIYLATDIANIILSNRLVALAR